MLLITVFVFLTIVSALNYFKTRKQRALVNNLNGPLTLPLVGSVHKFLFLKPQNFLQKSHEYLSKFGPFSRCWLFDRLFILTTDYEFVAQLLSRAEHLNTGYSNLLQPLYGDGILRLDGAEWQQRRQLLGRAIRPPMLADFVVISVQQTDHLVERLAAECEAKRSFDLQPYVANLVLDVVIESAIGVQGGAQRGDCSNFAKAVTALSQLFVSRFLHLYSANPIIYSVMCPRMKRRQGRLLQTINQLELDLIAQHRASMTSATKDKANELDNGNIYTIQITTEITDPTPMPTVQKPITLLNILLTSSIADVPLSDAQICAELNTYIFQGYMLTTTVLCFALVMISRYPSVQQQLLEELRCVWPDQRVAFDCTADQLQDLKYLECVLKETMRLYPAQPILARDLKENFPYTHTRFGDGVLPAGAEIYINIYEMLRAADQFDDADVFLPERHRDADKTPLYYGLGPRSCLAQQLNMLLLKSVIAELLLTYELLPLGSEVQPEVKLVLGSTNGFQVALRKRT